MFIFRFTEGKVYEFKYELFIYYNILKFNIKVGDSIELVQVTDTIEDLAKKLMAEFHI